MNVVLLLVALCAPAPLFPQALQRPSAQQQERPDPADTIPVPAFRFEPPVSPLGAFGLSMLLPGLGQAVLGEQDFGAAFVFWEGLTLAMTMKTIRQLRYQEDIGVEADSLANKRAQLENWLVLLVFNHLFAGAQAFVSANLWDFPADLKARALPGAAIGFGVQIRAGRTRVPVGRTRAEKGTLER